MRRSLFAAAVMVALWTVVLGVVYPLVTTGIAQAAFPHQADGSLIEVDGQIVGSALLGQTFEGEEWFHARPSAVGYDGAGSGGTNLGPSNPELIAAVEERVRAYRNENGLPSEVQVPVDAVTSSGSGLDPHISVANARLQARRVAEARGLSTDAVLDLVGESTEGLTWGFLGEQGVNVLRLNVALAAVDGS